MKSPESGRLVRGWPEKNLEESNSARSCLAYGEPSVVRMQQCVFPMYAVTEEGQESLTVE